MKVLITGIILVILSASLFTFWRLSRNLYISTSYFYFYINDSNDYFHTTGSWEFLDSKDMAPNSVEINCHKYSKICNSNEVYLFNDDNNKGTIHLRTYSYDITYWDNTKIIAKITDRGFCFKSNIIIDIKNKSIISITEPLSTKIGICDPMKVDNHTQKLVDGSNLYYIQNNEFKKRKTE